MKNNNVYIKLLLLIFTGLIILSFQGCDLFKKKYEKTENIEFNILTTGRNKMVIDSHDGDFVIRKSQQDSVVRIKAEVTKYVNKRELDEPINLQVDIDTSGSSIIFNGVTFRDRKIVKFEIGNRNSISYVIYVPDNFDILFEGTNNDLDISGMNNNVKAELTNGSIKVKNVYGEIILHSTNGEITASLDSTKKCNIETTNGSIKLKIDENFSAQFSGETTNGEINFKRINFDNLKQTKNSFNAQLGNKNVSVTLTSTNGNITIDRK